MNGFSHVLIIAVALGLFAVLAAAVATMRSYLRRHPGLRLPKHAGASHKEDPTALPPARRATDMLDSRQDTLGWTATDVTDDSQDQSGVEPGCPLGREKTVMVADDDPVVLYAITRRLQHMGYQVMRSPDASHALLGAMKVKPDLIILDINMPAGNGLATCEMLACDNRCAHIPVIIHSNLNDDAVKRRCLRLGAHYVEKSPHSWNAIKALVESLIGEQQAAATQTVSDTSPVAVSDAAGPTQKALATAGKTLPPKPSAQTTPPSGRRLVLCIESPQGRLEPIEHRLLALGIEVNRTSDPEEGFWTCFTERPIAMIIQIADDKRGLLALLSRAAQHPVTRSIPVLVINENNVVSAADMPSGVTTTLVKYPVDWESLLCELEPCFPMFHQDELTSPAVVTRPQVAAGHADEPLAITSRQSAAAAVSTGSLKVLCIDDDPVIAKSIANRLHPYNIKVLGAYDGTQGYLLAATEKPDVILLDLKMPNGEGNYVLGKLKENARTKDIPVIILTMETLAGVRRLMFSIGADAFMSKPIRWPELFEEMSRCVRLPKQLLLDYKLKDQLTLAEL
jgi:CheY-like chemotaxis protein